MSFRTQLITPPTRAAVSRTDLKLFMRVDDDDEDQLIAQLALAASRLIETQTRRALTTQTWEVYMDRFPHCAFFYLPHGPVSEIVQITYTDQGGVSQTVDPTTYALDQGNIVDQRVYLLDGETWPTDEAIQKDTVTVRFTAGYGKENDVPEDLKTAIKLLANHWYENREATVIGTISSELPLAVKAIVDANKVVRFPA